MAAAPLAPSAEKELLALLMTPQQVTDIGGIYSFVAPGRSTQHAFIFDEEGDLTDQPLPSGLTLTPMAAVKMEDKQTKVFGTASSLSKDFSAELSTGGLKIPVAFPIAVEASAAGKKSSSANSTRAQLVFLWVTRSVGYTLTGTATTGRASHVLHTEFYGGYFVADIDLSSTDKSKSLDLSAGLTLGELKTKTATHWGMKGSATLTVKNVRIHGFESGPDLSDSTKAIEMFEKWKESAKLRNPDGELIAVSVHALSEQNPGYQMTLTRTLKSIEQFYRDLLLGSLLRDFTARLHEEVIGGSTDLASADDIRTSLFRFDNMHLITKEDCRLNIQVGESQWATMRQGFRYTKYLVPGSTPVYRFAARSRDGSLVLKTNTPFDIVVYQDGVQKGFLEPVMHHADIFTGGVKITNKRPEEAWMLQDATAAAAAEPRTVDAETASYHLLGIDREGGVSKYVCINRDGTDFEFHADVTRAVAIRIRHANPERSVVHSSLVSLGGASVPRSLRAGGGGGGAAGGTALTFGATPDTLSASTGAGSVPRASDSGVYSVTGGMAALPPPLPPSGPDHAAAGTTDDVASDTSTLHK